MQLVEGMVVDSEERPVGNATVRITGDATDGSRVFGKAVTGDQGDFSFRVIPLDYDLWAESQTCPGITGPRVHVSKGQTKSVKLSMPVASDQPCPAPR